MPSLSAKFQPTYEDYLRINRTTTYNKPTLILTILMGLVTIGTLLGLVLGWIQTDRNRLMLYLLPPAMFVFYLFYTPFDMRRQSRKLAEKVQTIKWRVAEDGITVDKDSESKKYLWEMLGTAQETDLDYILFLKANRSDYIFIPKRAFKNPALEQQFQATITANLGNFR
jgi:hypothetical protein